MTLHPGGNGDKILMIDMENGAGIDYNLWNDIRPGEMWDNLHPFDTGYERMAERWFTAIQQVTLPVAVAVADPTNPKEFTEVTLDGGISNDANGETLTFRLTVTDDDGLTSSDITSVKVSDGSGGGGGCFINTASVGVPLKFYDTMLGKMQARSMMPGNPIFMLILFALCLCAGTGLKYGKGVARQDKQHPYSSTASTKAAMLSKGA